MLAWCLYIFLLVSCLLCFLSGGGWGLGYLEISLVVMPCFLAVFLLNLDFSGCRHTGSHPVTLHANGIESSDKWRNQGCFLNIAYLVQ